MDGGRKLANGALTAGLETRPTCVTLGE